MLYCNRIDDYEGIDINKTSESKKRDILLLLVWFK